MRLKFSFWSSGSHDLGSEYPAQPRASKKLCRNLVAVTLSYPNLAFAEDATFMLKVHPPQRLSWDTNKKVQSQGYHPSIKKSNPLVSDGQTTQLMFSEFVWDVWIWVTAGRMDDVEAKALHIFHESDPILSHLLTEFQQRLSLDMGKIRPSPGGEHS